jgi:predicted small secreted protein
MVSRRTLGTPTIVLLFGWVLAGCTAWRRDDHALRPPIPQRRPLQIWSGRQSLTTHGVEMRGDSLRAVPRWKPPTCDSCARFYAIAAIDSVRVRRFSAPKTTVLIAVLVALGYLTAGLAGAGGPGS